jgi:K+-sensing histidine kinase KdpD
MKAINYKGKNEINTKLLSTISHELRAPLTAIKGYSTMLLEYFPDLTVEETKEYIQSIDSATDRMTRLIESLLDVTRLEEGRLNLEKIHVDISKLIEVAVNEAEIRNGHHEILTALASDLPKIHIDPNRMRLVLDDLIDNATKRSPKGTEILVSLKADDQEIEIGITSRDPGIPECEFCDIPELSYRMEQIKGPGINNSMLELYICQRLIEAHNGRIWAESIVGKGTTIKFTLPLIS